MKSLTCIVCPIGCTLDIEESGGKDNLTVTGNRCPRGEVYAVEEIRAPKRVVTATCPINGDDNLALTCRRIPVKTTTPCLREKIPALLNDIYKARISLPVKAGDAVITNWNGEGFDIVATRTVNA